MSQTFYREESWRGVGYASMEDWLVRGWEGNFLRREGEDLLSMLDTWTVSDISANPVFEGDLDAALGAIKARTLVMPCTTDLRARVQQTAEYTTDERSDSWLGNSKHTVHSYKRLNTHCIRPPSPLALFVFIDAVRIGPAAVLPQVVVEHGSERRDQHRLVLVEQFGTDRATPVTEFLRWLVENPLTARAPDARPPGTEKPHVDGPAGPVDRIDEGFETLSDHAARLEQPERRHGRRRERLSFRPAIQSSVSTFSMKARSLVEIPPASWSVMAISTVP